MECNFCALFSHNYGDQVIVKTFGNNNQFSVNIQKLNIDYEYIFIQS